MKRRSTLEMTFEVLEIVSSGVMKPTQIMYKANMSWQPLMKIIKILIKKELICKIDAKSIPIKRFGTRYDKRSKVFYDITDKGQNLLNHFRKGKDIFQILE